MNPKVINLYKLIREVPNSKLLDKAIPLYIATIQQASSLKLLEGVVDISNEMIYWINQIKELEDLTLDERDLETVADTIEAMAEHYKEMATNILIQKKPDEYAPLGELLHPIFKLKFYLASGAASSKTIKEAHDVLTLSPIMENDIFLERSIELFSEVINTYGTEAYACSEDKDLVPDVSVQVFFNRTFMFN